MQPIIIHTTRIANGILIQQGNGSLPASAQLNEIPEAFESLAAALFKHVKESKGSCTIIVHVSEGNAQRNPLQMDLFTSMMSSGLEGPDNQFGGFNIVDSIAKGFDNKDTSKIYNKDIGVNEAGIDYEGIDKVVNAAAQVGEKGVIITRDTKKNS